MKFLAVDHTAADAIVSDRFLQSTEFEPGLAFANFLQGKVKHIQVNPYVNIIAIKEGAYILSENNKSQELLVFDLKNAPVFSECKENEALYIFQRMLRFAIKYWKNQRLAVTERMIPHSTKAVVFPLPISQKSSFRITVEREPDAKRMERRGQKGNYLFVFKCATSAGEGAKEEAEITQFRKAIQSLDDAKKQIHGAHSSQSSKYGSEITQIQVTELGGEEADLNLSPFQGFDNWNQWLTTEQKGFVFSTLQAPHRIEGPAGTGKTLCLVLKCIQQLREAEDNNEVHRSVFVTHSEATRSTIETLFEANDDRRYNSRDPYLSKQSLKVTTLQRLCADLLHTEISETEFLDRDAMESKVLQILYVNEAFDEAMNAEYPTHMKFLSKGFRDFLESSDGWTISEMLQHEISVVIKGRAEENLDKYRKLPSLKYGLPANSDADRGFVFVVFQKYQEKLHGSGQFDTDDVVLSAVGQLNTPIWRRRRKQEGYDSVFVDETHLFNMNELHVFHFLTKVEGPFPIAYSVDRSQALGDRGWSNSTIADVISPNGNQSRQQDKTIVNAIFRSSPDIINLAFSVTSSGATLFTNFDDPLQMAASAFTEEEERASMPPVYLACANDEAMIEGAFRRADQMVDEMRVSKGEILIVSFDEDVFKMLRAFTEEKNKPVEVIHRRGDIEVKDRAKEAGRFVLGHVDYVGGLEFAGAILIGVDKGRVPPTRGGDHDESQNFLSYASHNRLYVAITRAKYRIEILGVEVRGPSALLQSAFETGVLESARL